MSIFTNNNFKDVVEFHEKFAVPTAARPSFLGAELQEFREKFLEEELEEFKHACILGHMEDAADALVDLVYVALGTAHMMGLPWQTLWNEVQRANMSKERALSAKQSTRGTAFDVVKPIGWTPPSHTAALLQDAEVVSEGAEQFPTFTGYKDLTA
jgi:predicted HAD superfamily Cof-like phosphohydrolase